MSKIVQAANAMIANRDLISPVIMNEDEYFFVYNKKHKWSMKLQDTGLYSLWFYPGQESIEDLASLPPGQWNGSVPMIHYSDGEIGTREAKATFAELYTIVKERLYGIDAALDDIIGAG